MLHLRQRPITGFDKPTQLETAIAALALVVLTPVFLITATAIKLTSSGPILTVQESISLDQRRLRLFRFRTTGTAIGNFLRQTNIDELPQLINVLRGDRGLGLFRPSHVELQGSGTAW